MSSRLKSGYQIKIVEFGYKSIRFQSELTSQYAHIDKLNHQSQFKISKSKHSHYSHPAAQPKSENAIAGPINLWKIQQRPSNHKSFWEWPLQSCTVIPTIIIIIKIKQAIKHKTKLHTTRAFSEA